MTDSQQAIQMQTQQTTHHLQEKLEQIKFTLPCSSQPHSWKKSAYMKSLALKAQQSLNSVTLSEWFFPHYIPHSPQKPPPFHYNAHSLTYAPHLLCPVWKILKKGRLWAVERHAAQLLVKAAQFGRKSSELGKIMFYYYQNKKNKMNSESWQALPLCFAKINRRASLSIVLLKFAFLDSRLALG